MTRSRTGDDMYISPCYTVKDWRNLHLDSDAVSEDNWCTAADILKDRIKGRFLKPAQALIDMEEEYPSKTFGFAILALDFLVVETVQGFRNGLEEHNGSKKLFSEFLTNWTAFQDCVPNEADRKGKAEEIFRAGRCALHHTGSTDNLIVRVSLDQMIHFHPDGGIEINRNTFHKELSAEFNRYIGQLKNAASDELRANFRKKMNYICNM